ncbi:TRAP transporter permease [Stutzerimonas stutzeri]|nr:TRAP transporter fused permease subunit [Stutzerimonas stutzeri]MCQ4328116.1 TRAP transporter fused permease subunit [Stutzerimonas stutzeri]
MSLATLLRPAQGEAPWHPLMRSVGLLACALISTFIIYTTAVGKFPAQVQYGMVLLLGLIAVFCLKQGPLARIGRGGLDVLLSLLFIGMSLFSCIYLLSEYNDIAALREGLPNDLDLVCYLLGTIAVLEAARRVEGWVLLSIVGAALAYLLFGNYLPGLLTHRPFDITEVLEIAFSYQGIFGVALGAVVDVVLVFVILGVALRLTGAGDFFNFIALRATRRMRSGPAQASIIGSALFGSVNGSAPANVVATGVLTIPMMQRSGFKASFAGAVEAVASCSGQIMPPIMGVGAFIMAEITGIPYANIMLAALVPAFLYLFALSAAVALEASRLGIKPLEDQGEQAMNSRRLAECITLLTGFGTLIGMLFSGYSPTYCGLVAAATVLVVGNLLPQTRMRLPDFGRFLVDGGRDGLAVLISCAAIGIVIGAVSSTGLGIKLNQMIIALGSHSLLLALIMAAVCSILLGMGLPTAASYLMVVYVAGPAILELGVNLLQTHLFVFYFAVLSAITPPVALAVFAAAAIAKTSSMKIAGNAMRLSIVAFILPFAWIYHPEINLQDLSADNVLPTFAFIAALMIATFGLTAGHIGFFCQRLTIIERALLIAAGAFVLAPGWLPTVTGVSAIVFLLSFRYWRRNNVQAFA